MSSDESKSKSVSKDSSKKPPLESLGHDILVNYVFRYLSEEDILKLGTLSPILKEYTNDPAVWHDLFFRTFGTQPNPFTIYNWPEMYRWRSSAGLYTWGEASKGRLGYLLDDPSIPEEIKTPEHFHQGVCRPHQVKFPEEQLAISDVVSGGWWSAIVTAKGDIYGIGELDDHPIAPEPYYDPVLSAQFNRLRPNPGLFNPPIRIGGIINHGAPAPDFGLNPNTRLNFPFTPHRPRIDNPASQPSAVGPSMTFPNRGVITNMPATAINNDNNDNSDNHNNDTILDNNLRNNIIILPDDQAENVFGRPPQLTEPLPLYNEEENKNTSNDNEKNEENKNENENIDYYQQFTSRARSIPKKLDTLTNRKIEFVGIGGGGRTHLVGLDSDHNVWVWDKLFCAPGIRLDLDFNRELQNKKQKTSSADQSNSDDGKKEKDKTPKSTASTTLTNVTPTREIRKLAAGWNCTVALVEDVGLVVWYGLKKSQQIPVTQKELKQWKAEERSCKMETTLVPKTNFRKGDPDYVVDFHAGDRFIVYVTEEGKLYKVTTESPEAIKSTARVPLTEFDDMLQKIAKTPAKTTNNQGQDSGKKVTQESDFEYDTDYRAKFIKVRGGYKYIAAISDSDNVLCANAHEGIELPHTPEAPEELQKTGCISVAVGDHHYLALLRGGKLLSWGNELQSCGSLGLGRLTPTTTQNNRWPINGGTVSIAHPTPVETPGKVLAIAAGGWQSCAIITNK